jgi:hypothetical protein
MFTFLLLFFFFFPLQLAKMSTCHTSQVFSGLASPTFSSIMYFTEFVACTVAFFLSYVALYSVFLAAVDKAFTEPIVEIDLTQTTVRRSS